LDLTSFASIKQAAQEFTARSDRLDILINNAGIMMTPYSKTKEGYEIQFGTNHVGHALFTKLLLPTLLKTAELPSADVRVVNVSSGGHMFAPKPVYDQDRLEKYHTARRYGQSKLANIYHARELQRRYPSITAASIHPGVIVTDLYLPVGKAVPLATFFTKIMAYFTPNVQSGAKNQLWAATGPLEKVRDGYYFTPVGNKSSGSWWYGRDAKLAEQLWDWTEEQIKKHE
jgi:NAD(P)-dependent dehydrogenase (short-subunit alcohol dehydrogenase family)